MNQNKTGVAYQIEMALQEVVNARASDNVMLTMDEFVAEVYYYVSTTNYLEGAMRDSNVNRFNGSDKLKAQIKRAILKDQDAMVWLR